MWLLDIGKHYRKNWGKKDIGKKMREVAVKFITLTVYIFPSFVILQGTNITYFSCNAILILIAFTLTILSYIVLFQRSFKAILYLRKNIINSN